MNDPVTVYRAKTLVPESTAFRTSFFSTTISTMPFYYPEEVSARLQERCARLRQLDRDIPELQAALDQLVEERKALRREVWAYPILNLPNELTELIFRACVSPGVRVMPSRSIPPLSLSHVCKQWRTIALSIPHLWNCVRPRAVSPNTVRLLELWLARAKTLPISISLSSTLLLPVEIPSWASRHSHRWEHVSLVLPHIELSRLYWMDVSALKSLVLGGSGDPRQLIDRVHTFGPARNLQELTLLRGISPFKFDIPWGQLTTLSATDLTVHECLRMLRSATRLVDCTLFIRLSSHSQPTHLNPTLYHPTLAHLILHYGASHLSLLSALSLPALTRIQLSLESGSDNVSAFVRFGKHAPLLSHMAVEAGALSPEEFLECLRATPRVRVLEFQSPHRLATGKILRGLTLGDGAKGAGGCLPSLTHLRMTDESKHLDDAVFGTLVGMIRSRNGTGNTASSPSSPSPPSSPSLIYSPTASLPPTKARLKSISLMLLVQSKPKELSAEQVEELRAIELEGKEDGQGGIEICIETRKGQVYPPCPS
ncbi:F-box domain-containing protein [Favolaschia claudopus]|uniref:F-box domain-containing protein n=1 Tax=Favolaschia claudopus TaxID=2862362 RepID=A0AAW0BZP7_9AGAR